VLTIGSSTGTFDLTIGNSGTSNKISALSAGITASDLQSAIGSKVGSSNVTVTGTAGGPFTITFSQSLGPVSVAADAGALGTLDAQHINVAKTIQGNQAIYTITYLTGVSETLTVLVPDVSMYQQAGNGTASIARI